MSEVPIVKRVERDKLFTCLGNEASKRPLFDPNRQHRGRGGWATSENQFIWHSGKHLWSIEQPAAAVANEYYVGAINRVGIEDLGDDDFYGTSYFVDPEGKFVGECGDPNNAELIVRDLDLSLIKTVRDRWAFYRDRRPEAYDELVAR